MVGCLPRRCPYEVRALRAYPACPGHRAGDVDEARAGGGMPMHATRTASARTCTTTRAETASTTAVWRIIAAAAISANLIHQGKKQLRIHRSIDGSREGGRHGGVHLASHKLPHCAVGWKSYPSLKPRRFPHSVDFLEKASSILHRCSANSETGLKSLLLGNAT